MLLQISLGSTEWMGPEKTGQTAKVNSHASPFVGDGEIGKKGGPLQGGRRARRSQQEQERKRTQCHMSVTDESTHVHHHRRGCCLRKESGSNNGGVSGGTDMNKAQ